MSSAARRLKPISNGVDGCGTNDFRSPVKSDSIFQLQLEQRDHDDLYHPEISRLSIHQRLNHLALHFAKYAGRIANAVRDQNEEDIDRTITDIFIIALSSANVLNIHVGQAISETSPNTFSNEIEPLNEFTDNFDTFEMLVQVASMSGRMAKACETLDHLESFPFREEIGGAVVGFAHLAITLAFARQFDILNAVRMRLSQVRSAKMFYGHI